MRRAALFAGLTVLATASSARAQDSVKPVCADRPGKGAAPCTVDKGHWQVEVDVADFTRDRSAGATVETSLLASTNVKYGISDRLDLELNITPLQSQRAEGGGRASGLGDTIARAKFALIQGDTAVSLLPYVKLPTARRDLGNGAVEEGLSVPVSVNLPGQLTLALTPEIDALKDAFGSGRHAAYQFAGGLSRPLTATFTGSVELWDAEILEPSGHASQASLDLGLAWMPVSQQTLQVDGGLNLGLNHATPQIQVYVGLSRRF